MNELKHENIVNLVDETCEGLVFEYLKNGELFDYIAKKKFSEKLTRYYFRQLIYCLKYMHHEK